MTSRGVSFIVPVYNKADWLPTVIDRIAAQRGGFVRQFVFVDDGSTDNSLQIVRNKTAGWGNVVIETQTNAGSAAATNRGIALADQPYVKFVDADDLLHADATGVLLDALESASDACLAFGRSSRFSSPSDLDLDGVIGMAPVRRILKPLRQAIYRSLFNPTQFLVRTGALRAVGGCDERVVFSQEYALTMRLARRWDFLAVDATIVLFSAAIPDQGGHHHVNEQWPAYWADLFAQHGYRPIDAIRLKVWNDPAVCWWYKQNLMLFADPIALDSHPALRAEADGTVVPTPSLVHPEVFAQSLRRANPSFGRWLKMGPQAWIRSRQKRAAKQGR